MIYLPSQEVQDRMRSELSGVFIDRALTTPRQWFVAKLPMNLIREIVAGAPISLRVWAVEIDNELLLSFGLTVYEDLAAPRTFFGTCRSDEETADLRTVLAAGAFPIQFHNETLLPLLYVEGRVDTSLARDVLALGLSPGQMLREGISSRERANDVVEAVLSGQVHSLVKAACELSVTFVQRQPIRVHVPGIGSVDLTDTNEGGELERLTYQMFESLFPHGAFINPRVGEGKKRRELCDVLAVSRFREVENEGIFVVQNKVASAFPEGLNRRTSRRAKSIQNNILDAVGQLSGAIKTLKAGEPVYRVEDGTCVDTDPSPHMPEGIEPLRLAERANQIGQGIVVISDMHEGVEWDEVFRALAKVWMETGYYCQVLDLQELGRLVAHSRSRPAILEGLLLRRGQAMVESKTPLVRFHFQI